MIDYQTDHNRVVLVKRMIKQAELIRERGNNWAAIDLLLEAEVLIFEPVNSGSGLSSGASLVLAEVFGQEIVCFKHLYQNTRREEYLESMEEKIQQGLNLNIPDENKAVFHLRRGDTLTTKGDYEGAERSYQKALDLVELLENHATAEYMGHLGESMSNNGKANYAVELISRALNLMTRQKIVEWHKLIIVSGLYGRLAKAAFKNGEYRLAVRSLWVSYRMARKLKKEHGMPQRLNQFYQRLLGKGE